VGEFDTDYYAVTVPAGNDLIVDQSYASGVFFELRVWDDSVCSNPQFTVAFGQGPVNQLVWSNDTGSSAVVALSVSIPFPDFGYCTTYDLDLFVTPNPCLTAGLEDSFEPNQECSAAVALTSGTQSGLFVTDTNLDWFSVDVEPGDLLTVLATFSHAAGDVDLRLYQASTCGGFFNQPIASSETSTDDEFLQWVNTEPTTQTFQVLVSMFGFGGATTACNNYDLTVLFNEQISAFCFGDGLANVGNGPVGCPCANESAIGAGEGCMNSLGYGASLSTSGLASVGLDNLQITISQARPMQPALALQGASLISVPFKDGLLCMGNPTERLEVMFTDATGSATTAESIAVNGHVGGGDTRYYQVWYRDPGGISPCGNGSNFSHGLFVNWQ
jgi:hypothetical protein